VPEAVAPIRSRTSPGRKGALCRGTLVYEVDDGARKAPYKLKILAQFRSVPISPGAAPRKTDDSVTHGRRPASAAAPPEAAPPPSDALSLDACFLATLSHFRRRGERASAENRHQVRERRGGERRRHVRQPSGPLLVPLPRETAAPPSCKPQKPGQCDGRPPFNARKPPLPEGSRGLQLSSRCYLAFSRISTSRQFLVADSGRVSAMTTRSPMPAVLFSS
jgi:hypothetical protein